MTIDAKACGQYTIGNDSFCIQSDGTAVQLEGEKLAEFTFSNEEERAFFLGEAQGKTRVDTSNTAGLQIRRELFLSDDGKLAAIRFAVRNQRSGRIHLEGINSLVVRDDRSFLVGGGPMREWKVLRYPFHKSDVPSYFRPTTVDKDFEDAVFSCVGAVPGQGVLYNRLNAETRTISSGPILIVRNADRRDTPLLMLCTTGIEKHLMEMFLTTTEDRQNLKHFQVECTFDCIAMDPGDEQETHWLMLTTGAHESDLLTAYTDTVAAMYNLPPLKQPPMTVYCSWYFYTKLLNQEYLEQELTTIRERNIAIDVFQIDDGWMDDYGSYQHDTEKFPHGMAYAAKKIKEAGMIPGIWSCPFVIQTDSPILKKYPDIHQLDLNGDPIIYDTSINDCYVVDPTAENAKEYFEEIYTRFKKWGYTYHKIDWLRAMYEFDTVRFRDPKVNRAMAYSKAMGYIRDALGPDCYVAGCGGLSDPGNFGTSNSLRTCKDVRGIWQGPAEVAKSGALVHIKQNLLRNYINRFYHLDPDATQIRVQHGPYFEHEKKSPVGVYQSEGHFTDEEAFTICAQQYLCGGLVMISERFPALQEERMALLRHIAPNSAPPARIIDFDTPVCPTLFLTEVTPRCSELGTWWTLAVGNWEDDTVTRTLRLRDAMIPEGSEQFAVMEFKTQQFMGLFSRDDEIDVALPAHAIRVLRLTPWDGESPKVLGTDFHITGGASEIAECSVSPERIEGTVQRKWNYPIAVTAGFPHNREGITLVRNAIPVGTSHFRVSP